MKIYWTEHSKVKMRQYGLSATKLTRIIRKPERTEQGIAEGTTAVMATNAVFSGRVQTKPRGEIWLMYQDSQHARKIISAWRYPGVSKPGEPIPIPKEIKNQILNIKNIY